MPTEDRFAPDDPLPLFLSRHADEEEQRDSPVLLNMSILVLTTALVGLAMMLSLGNPAKVFADVRASLTGTSTSRPDTVRATVKIQSAADVQALPATLPPTATGAPGRDNIISATFDNADQKQAETSEASSAALFQQFQAWAAQQDAEAQVEQSVRPVEDARAQVEPVQPVEDGPAPIMQDAQASVRPALKHKKIRHVQNARADQNARAEMRPVRNPRARVQRDRNAPVEPRQAQGQPVQNAQPPQAPSFFQSLGGRQ
ncbi:MAG TPA: hypothetical protein VKR55_18050 [Bradyrhizobium sp.]|uniref:hypothetical protein n=1 Tax=Bradyrhizobium sp. TaxID=376 RepID=UPI002B6EC5E4|nr:hypothetical protein [Bradyrhizobium sp.]HLZ04034.1 hypothetical protein [Bradyrhizobium sp.]